MKQRLWTSTGDPDGERLLNEFGFRVVALPATDMLTGLQTGLIEAIDVPPLFALLDRSFQEAEYMTMLNFAPLNAAIVMSMQAWNRIPAAYRPELEAAVEQAVVDLRQSLHQAEDEAIEEMIARGLQAVELNADELSAWQDLATSVYPALACNREFPELFQKMLSLVQE
jgi:TRAP-type C4-dicarboxylate transport system substrate-binding protein